MSIAAAAIVAAGATSWPLCPLLPHPRDSVAAGLQGASRLKKLNYLDTADAVSTTPVHASQSPVGTIATAMLLL